MSDLMLGALVRDGHGRHGVVIDGPPTSPEDRPLRVRFEPLSDDVVTEVPADQLTIVARLGEGVRS